MYRFFIEHIGEGWCVQDIYGVYNTSRPYAFEDARAVEIYLNTRDIEGRM